MLERFANFLLSFVLINESQEAGQVEEPHYEEMRTTRSHKPAGVAKAKRLARKRRKNR